MLQSTRMKSSDEHKKGSDVADLWVNADRELLQVVDRQMDDAYRRGREHMPCAPGCTECCIGPFGVHRLDALRLGAGLALLERHHPERAAAIRLRAEKAAELMVPGFPGDVKQGIFDGDTAEEEDAYLDSHADLPCPVLDPQTGRCELYAHRPLTCRIYGPAALVGTGILDPCRLCFTEASDQTISACRADPDPDDLEEQLLENLERVEGERGLTLIPFALILNVEK